MPYPVGIRFYVAALVLAACNAGVVGQTDEQSGADAGPGGQGDDDVGPNKSLPCDGGFTFAPYPAATGSMNEVIYETTSQAFPYVDVEITGPGDAKKGDVDLLQGQSPWRWSWEFSVDAPGEWSVVFSAGDPRIEIARCQFEVSDTGSPPETPQGDCAGKVCGESDGQGGSCSRCPMVESEGGACMDPPSPIGPSGADSWSCLDNAGCTEGGSCRIWCPGEPCDMAAHPEGCPNGVEACWVPPDITDYEEACRQCCNGRYHAPTGEYACWDNQYNVCRYPGECGTGPPNTP